MLFDVGASDVYTYTIVLQARRLPATDDAKAIWECAKAAGVPFFKMTKTKNDCEIELMVVVLRGPALSPGCDLAWPRSVAWLGRIGPAAMPASAERLRPMISLGMSG